jgi:hypothetical protein
MGSPIVSQDFQTDSGAPACECTISDISEQQPRLFVSKIEMLNQLLYVSGQKRFGRHVRWSGGTSAFAL